MYCYKAATGSKIDTWSKIDTLSKAETWSSRNELKVRGCHLKNAPFVMLMRGIWASLIPDTVTTFIHVDINVFLSQSRYALV
jgi:hypothetical protein